MNTIKLVLLCGLVICVLVVHKYTLEVKSDFTIGTNLNELVMTYDEARIFAEAVVYMIDLDLEWGSVCDIKVLNQEYVECFNKTYLTNFIEDRPSYLYFIKSFASKEESQLLEYNKNKNAHNALTQEELVLLDKYNKFCDEYHEILDYNDEILSMIAQKNETTLEMLKEIPLHTSNYYDRIIYGDEEYGHLLKSTYIEMSQELKDFKNEYQGVYPFNYEVDLPWEYKNSTSQYDANLYGVYYQDVTENFYVIYPENKDNDGVPVQNKYRLISYTVYNDCIEVNFNSIDGNMSAIVLITDGVISDIYAYMQKNTIKVR